jgi:hypothetical protein
METVGMKLRLWSFILAALFLGSCATKVLKYDKDKVVELEKNSEFDNAVKIEIPEEVTSSTLVEGPTTTIGITSADQVVVATTTTMPKRAKDKKTDTKSVDKRSALPVVPVLVHEPDLESQLGFEGRRPLKDPFRVGEKVVHDVSYLKMTAGQLTFEVKPFAMVNGRKSYNFYTGIKTASFFSSFYAVDDFVTTLMDYELFIPSVFKMTVKETSQIKNAQMLFDWDKKQARYWEKKVTEKDGETEKKQEWEIPEYSQNVFTIAFYMRVFQWDVGTVNQFRVAEDGKNLVFKGTAVRRETISTDAGEFKTIVIRPEMLLKGKFEQTGDNFFYLTDDDRKFVVKIESKIKIGNLVSEVVQLNPGR